jgi:hypothetical protein
MYQRLLLGMVILVMVSACGSAGAPAPTPTTAADALAVEDPWVRPSIDGMGGMNSMGDAAEEGDGMQMAGSNSAAYMTIRNAGANVDRLILAESDVAQAVELHIGEMVDGVMSMRKVEGIEVPAGGTAELAPGGLHIMLINLTRELNPGDMVNLRLTFENAGVREVQATVREP